MIQLLLNYQKIDAQLKECDNKLLKSEEYLKYSKAKAFLKTVNENLTQLNDRAGSVSSLYKAKAETFEKVVEALGELKASFSDDADEKELAFLRKKVQEYTTQLEALESEMNKLSKEATEITKQFALLAKSTKTALQQRDENKIKVEEIKASIESEKKPIEAQLKEMAKDIDGEIMKKYNEKRKDGKFPIVFEAKGGFCSACGTELAIAETEKLKAQKIIECSNCHKLIYLK